MAEQIEMIIESIRVSLTNQHRIVVLKEKNGNRHLPIWIGIFESESITLALQDVTLARPQTHDLIKNIIRDMGGRLIRSEIVRLQDDVFYSNLVIQSPMGELAIDCRPSDTIALAVRCHVPIMIDPIVLEAAGFVPDQEIEENISESESLPDWQDDQNIQDDRLSVFESFLETLSHDKNFTSPKDPSENASSDTDAPSETSADDSPDAPDEPPQEPDRV